MMLPPVPCCVHLPQRRAGGEERAVEMDGEQLLPFGERELVERRHDLDAGIADQDVDAAEGLRSPSPMPASTCASLVTSIATPIACDAGLVDLGGGGIRRLLVEVGDRRLRAFAREFRAISLPMPLAAPVMNATLPSVVP